MKLKPRIRTFKWKVLSGFFLLIVLIFVSLGGYWYFYMSGEEEQHVKETIGRYNEQIETSLNHYFDDLHNIVFSLSSHASTQQYLTSSWTSKPYRSDALPSLREAIQSMTTTRRLDISGLFVVDRKGIAYVSNAAAGVPIDYAFGREPWFRQITGEFSPSVSGIHRQTYGSGEWVVSIGSKIGYTNNGNELGALFIDLDYNTIRSVFDRLTFIQAAQIVLLDAAGNVVYHTNSRLVGQPDPELPLQLAASFRGEVKPMTLSGRRMLVSSQILPDLGWHMVLAVPTDKIVSDARKGIHWSILVALATLLLSSAIATVLGSHVARPVLALHQTVRKVKLGDFSVRSANTSNDEIGLLATSFNAMLDEIERLISEVYRGDLLRQQLELKQQEAQLQALQNQIDPHFLYNTLDAIAGTAMIDGQDEVVSAIHALADSFRYNLRSEPFVTVGEELAHVSVYWKIFTFRFGDGIGLHIRIPPAVLERTMPRLVVQPIVENVLKHAFPRHFESRERRITIHAEETGHDVALIVEDNGIGMPGTLLAALNHELALPADQRSGLASAAKRGIGLANIADRLRLYQGTPGGVRLLERAGGGTRVEISLK